jgi:membrane-associated protease RseP (regulator of RpoE activity)
VLWPIFVPKVGAVILLKEEIKDPYIEACLGISGPIAGLLATGAVDFIGIVKDFSDLKFCATAGYAIHLFNLIPFGDLDGGHVASFIGKWLWIFGAALLLGLFFQFSSLAWHTNLVLLFILCSGVMKMSCWMSSKGSNSGIPKRPGKKARLIMASLYGLLILICVLGLFSKNL